MQNKAVILWLLNVVIIRFKTKCLWYDSKQCGYDMIQNSVDMIRIKTMWIWYDSNQSGYDMIQNSLDILWFKTNLFWYDSKQSGSDMIQNNVGVGMGKLDFIIKKNSKNQLYTFNKYSKNSIWKLESI